MYLAQTDDIMPMIVQESWKFVPSGISSTRYTKNVYLFQCQIYEIYIRHFCV